MARKEVAIERPIEWPRAAPGALEGFDPRTKVCTMNCGPHREDPRSDAERKYLCDDCMPAPNCEGSGVTAGLPAGIPLEPLVGRF